MSDATPVRLSHLIRHCAPGSLNRDQHDQLFTLMDSRYWCDEDGAPLGPVMDRVDCVRQVLGIEKQLRHPPKGEDQAIPAIRFPSWCRCALCGQIYRRPWKQQESDTPVCQNPSCNSHPLLQLPWVLVHPKGYLDDVPWHWLTHRKAKSACDEYNKLYLKQEQGRLELRCRACDASHAFLEVALKTADFFSSYVQMRRQPWLRERVPPNELQQPPPLALEVGDLRIHASQTTSALVIPPESRMTGNPLLGQLQRREQEVARLKKLEQAAPAAFQAKLNELADNLDCTPETLLDALEQLDTHQDSPDCGEGKLEMQEYRALTTPIPDLREDEEFITRHLTADWKRLQSELAFQSTPWKIMSLIGQLVAVQRLREIMVHQGFTRPVAENLRLVPPDLHGAQDWLPAIELFGEGLFIRFDEPALRHWEGQEAVRQRCDILRQRAEAVGFHLPTPRFVLLHTFAHLLIRQLETYSGYPAASLTERIYAWEPGDDHDAMAGVLIYTTSPDVAGTLGGLDELAEPKRLLPLLEAVFNHAQWCALDPVCGEHQGQGPHLLNLAACHGCVLVPDTACAHHNLLLDRILLKGDREQDLRPLLDFAPLTAS
ncbi:DrmB family protein [Thiolapillus sp.]